MAGGLTAATAAWLTAYGPIGLGVALGIAGRYGQTLHEAGELRGQSLRADVLQFGVLSLIAIWIADTAHLEGTTRVMAAAMCGAAGERLYRIVVSRFLKRAEGDDAADGLAVTAKAAPSTIVKIPGGSETPAAIIVQAATPDPPLRAELREAYHEPVDRRPPADQIGLLFKMKGPPSSGGS